MVRIHLFPPRRGCEKTSTKNRGYTAPSLYLYLSFETAFLLFIGLLFTEFARRLAEGFLASIVYPLSCSKVSKNKYRRNKKVDWEEC